MSGFTQRLEIQSLMSKLLFLLFFLVCFIFKDWFTKKTKTKTLGHGNMGPSGQNGGEEKSIRLFHVSGPTRPPGEEPQ